MNMEDKRPPFVRRPPSFNPEAATFSPTTNTAVLWPSAGKLAPTPFASPRKMAIVPDTAEDGSPFRTAPELRPVYEAADETNSPQPRGARPDSGYMPLDLHDLIRALEQAQREAAKNVFPTMQSIDTSMPYLPPGLFSPQRRMSSFSAPEVDELNKTLGLPGVVSKDKAGEEAPLMEQALDKPLTANALAHYMNAPANSETTEAVDLTPSHHLGALLEQTNKEDPPARLVQPPPGFFGEIPRMIHAGEPKVTSYVIPEPQSIPTGPPKFSKARRFSDLQCHDTLQHHHHAQYRVPSNRRNTRPRAPTRTKRSDQGPEPSAADIYPDDAVYMPPNGPSSTRRPSFAVSDLQFSAVQDHPFISPSHLRTQRAIIQDPASWPTPAEVYAGKVPPSTTSLPTQQLPPSSTPPPPAVPSSPIFDIYTDYCPPSTADIYEADGRVDALIDLAPYLFALELPDTAMWDERPLTPGQHDGSRYGLRFWGIGLGDCWKGVVPPGGGGF